MMATTLLTPKRERRAAPMSAAPPPDLPAASDRVGVPAEDAPDSAPEAARLPAGTVTFFCVDVEESTRLREARPAALEAALARREALLRVTIAASGRIVFKTDGGAIHAAVVDAAAVLAAVLAAQRALAADDWEAGPLRVRTALHRGPVVPAAGDYVGPTVTRAARLQAAGHGGQILLSGSAAKAARPTIPPEGGLDDLGSRPSGAPPRRVAGRTSVAGSDPRTADP